MKSKILLVALSIVSLTAEAQSDPVSISNDVFSQFGYGAPKENPAGPAQQKRNWTEADFRQELARQMAETDLLDNPEKLQKLANAAAAYGVEDKLPPFAELAQKAKRRAEMKTFQNLMLGNVDAAIDAARLSGSPFADRPVKIKPNDPNDFA